MSSGARLMCGIALVLIPTIVYGGLTILGVVSRGAFGLPGPKNLSDSQISLYRAGHAHAGVLTLLALLLEILTEYAALPLGLVWPVRVAAIAAPLLVSGGFFGIAHARGMKVVLYIGVILLVATTLTVGIGLIRA